MERKSIGCLLIILLLLANTASAANWIYLQRHEATRYGPPSTEYLDADSVVREGGMMAYWTMWVLDKDLPPGHPTKILWKREVSLSTPLQQRYLETYQYDAAGNKAVINNFFYTKPQPFIVVEPGSEDEELITRVLEYAKESKEADSIRPDYMEVSKPKWYGSVEFSDCDLYWDIHSIAACPRDNPTTIEIIVKWVWKKEGLGQRKAYLNAREPGCGEIFEKLSYTMVHYRFFTNQNKMRVLSVNDYDVERHRIGYSGDAGWQNIEGTKDKMARTIAQNWINDSDGGN